MHPSAADGRKSHEKQVEMSHFAYFYAGGVINPNTVLPHDFFTHLEQNLFKAINGDDGGTWAPGAAITIGGAGIVISGPSVFSGVVELSGTSASFLGSSLTLNSSSPFVAQGTSQFEGATGFTAAVTYTGTTVDVLDSPLTLDSLSPLVANGTATFNDTATFTSGVVHSGATSMQSVSIQAASVISAPVTMSGNGQIVSRIAFGSDSSSLPPFSKSLADLVIIEDSVLTAPRTYVLDSVGAQAGSIITFRKDTGGNDVEIRASGGALICTLSTTAGFRWVDLVYTTQWELLRFEVA
jgi:hypothetical protein